MLRPGPSSVFRCSLLAFELLHFTHCTFLFIFYRRMPYTLNGLMLWVWLARRSRGSVTALFSLFEKAMLSASQNDITLRAPYWSPRTKHPYLKKQSTQLMLQECSILLAQCLGKQAPHAYPVVQCIMMYNVKNHLNWRKNYVFS